MNWFVLTNCDNPRSYHNFELTHGRHYTSIYDVITALLGCYKYNPKIQCLIKVDQFLETIIDLIKTVNTLPNDTIVITNYYRTEVCCRILLYKSESTTKVQDIAIDPIECDQWFDSFQI